MHEINETILTETYEKYQILKAKMKESSKKYRISQKGKDTTKLLQNKYALVNKLDDNYRQNINLKQRERYKKNKELKQNQYINDDIITI